jgi:hypothetical protein
MHGEIDFREVARAYSIISVVLGTKAKRGILMASADGEAAVLRRINGESAKSVTWISD